MPNFNHVFGILFINCVLRASFTVNAFSTSNTKSATAVKNPKILNDESSSSSDGAPPTYSFSVPLLSKRPKPESFVDKFIELWNDPRPVTSLIGNQDRTVVGNRMSREGTLEEIPYCIVSDEFVIQDESFEILLYPRGRFVSGSSDGGGIASAYLRYLPKEYGDEVDIAWNLQLCISKDQDDDFEVLSISTSGGLPKSNTTWSAAMTFCHEVEAVESVGRATDWGSSIWSAGEVCEGLGRIFARGSITVFDKRQGETSFSFPPKGAMGDVIRSSSQPSFLREFRAGEVIVPCPMDDEESAQAKKLKASFVYPGIDYRVMTMVDCNGNPIFSTTSLSTTEEKKRAKLALRPCGWKLQRQLWQQNGMMQDWPIEVEVDLLANVTSTRFNVADSAIPRVVAAFQRDWKAYTLALTVAIMPIPIALLVRTFISFYAIPSASMEPTLMRGDVLLVEKLPGIYDRTKRGDVVLFRPPSTLTDLITSSSSSPISSTSLFVKRLVGVPGDKDIQLNDETREITIGGKAAVGPNRDLCEDEPLRLIDKMLQSGKGRTIDELGEDETFVVGDCKAVSVDSRVFGVLPKENIVGKPVARIWPPNRIQLSNKF